MMDKNRQRQVWQRVYGQMPPPPDRPISREGAAQCIRRLEQNLKFYEANQRHSIYGPAFGHLIRQTQEQIQMLRQITAMR